MWMAMGTACVIGFLLGLLSWGAGDLRLAFRDWRARRRLRHLAGTAMRGAPPIARDSLDAMTSEARVLARLDRARQRQRRSGDFGRARSRGRATGRRTLPPASRVAHREGGARLLLRVLQRRPMVAVPCRAHASDLSPQRLRGIRARER